MSIKGKRKSKPRPVPKAPRHVPVAAPTPFLRRSWVQITAGFLVGVVAMVVLVWVTNGLRANEAEAQADTKASQRMAAATAYQQAVRGAYSQVGVVDQGIPPTIFVEMDAALDALAKGKAPPGAATTFDRAADDAAQAGKTFAAFDVAPAVTDQGFNEIEVVAFTDSAEALTRVLDLYRQAARVAASASEVTGAEQQRLTDVAVDLRDTARRELSEGWVQYQQALRAGGMLETPTGGGLVPDLPGGG